MSDNAFLVDTSKCSGCRACQVACKEWNGLPGQETEFFEGTEYTNPAELSAMTWNHVKFFPIDKSNPEKPIWTIMHKKCYHCNEANCIAVCPEKAISKVEGWTIINQKDCIGCGSCVEACIYKVPHLSEKDHVNDVGARMLVKEKSYKCNACLVNKRKVPACVTTCPTGALTIVNRGKAIAIAGQRVEELKKEFPNASIYGRNEFGGLKVITILRDKPEKYGLRENVKRISQKEIEAIRDMYSLFSLFTFGLPFLKRTAFRMARVLTRRA